MDRVVFRLRQLPEDADRLKVVQLLSKSLGVESSAIDVQSLARSTDPWVLSKTATLQFNETLTIQEVLKENKKGNITKSGDEWKVRVENLKDSLVLDSHFRGLTPLSDPKVHDADCIAISGLSSHPFGSWQPKGASKTFMWIRDALPKSLPSIRPIIYGYDTTLVNSNSFQSILDLALNLLSLLKANGWNSPTSKPLVFLAHSLGGIVLKQALVSLANHMRRDDLLRKAIRGAIFFGVPNLGMEQSHLMAMVDGQPNEAIVDDLSVNSEYLCQLDEQFAGITYLQGIHLYWAYETRKSPTVSKNSEGVWERSGPEEILVTQQSAARGLYQLHSRSHLIFPINENHSNMVKFAENDPNYSIVVDKLVQIVAQVKIEPAIERESALSTAQNDTSNTETKASVVERFLDAPKQDYRLEQIEKNFKNTFDWAYDQQKPGLNQWLQKGTGLFWINGKPGSGKSTLMKFIVQDSRTDDLLSDWRTSAVQIRAAFFFHYRGNTMQKSFEGLLRSVLTQIIKQCNSLSSYLWQSTNDEPMKSHDWTLSRLQRALFQILEQDQVPLHLCLFLDALDEYDGRLEPICKFLCDLSRIPQTTTKRIQICFSSRPWDIFIREFKDCPGFSIQDYTRDDIRDYCLGSIRNEDLTATVLEDLVPVLVERSKGVFLWVKLVVKNLAQAFRAETNGQDLEKRLKALPSELDEYYAELIDRIPHAHRLMVYVMLEITVRSREPISPKAFVCALSTSRSQSHAEYMAAYTTLRRQRFTKLKRGYYPDLARQYSSKYCGGLIEVVKTGTSVARKDQEGVQVFHQTVEDFVMSPRFKALILGNLAKVTTENGNSYLAKLYFKNQPPSIPTVIEHMITKYTPLSLSAQYPYSGLKYYARAAEITTGRSMKDFWGSVPASYYGRSETKSLFKFAVEAGLQLLISEKLAEDPEVLKKSTEPLITKLMSSWPRPWVASMTRLLLHSGYRMDQDPKAFSCFVDYFDRVFRFTRIFDGPPDEQDQYLDAARILLEHGQSSDVDIQLGDDKRQRLKGKPLHIAPSPLAELLLEYGANVNALDSIGQTPLDYKFGKGINTGQARIGRTSLDIYKEGSEFIRKRKLIYEGLYKLISLLVSKGGITRKASEREIRRRLEEFAEYGWETKALYRALLPTPAPS
ncbi:hypothetical protein PFICI_14136 [Pestalotiopsis fici W106-1]|uniref:Nephrocystin 3-like N-terminal domain-containing protein n=1 Tax=Pestalotiopsis fici (strain W106-1 / CGMCC3.15140) TaxID=1229662 RepID=W3WK39_PESFW|nr:uncharacterized protein PFICI_14136 [Pestalotiopsis fici W106-1]ETS74270.1 hypothetical protein PFICI_14136 [Pestalotiopsis fici W106-1]